jgi:hypothetical protein
MSRVGSAMSRDEKDFALGAMIGLVFVLACIVGVLLTNRPHARHFHPTIPLYSISNHATYAQVKKNFKGKPAGVGAYLQGFKDCAAWTNGKKGRGWVVVFCEKGLTTSQP